MLLEASIVDAAFPIVSTDPREGFGRLEMDVLTFKRRGVFLLPLNRLNCRVFSLCATMGEKFHTDATNDRL